MTDSLMPYYIMALSAGIMLIVTKALPFFFKARVPWITLKGEPILLNPEVPGIFAVINKIKTFANDAVDMVCFNEHGWLPAIHFERGEYKILNTNPPIYMATRAFSQYMENDMTEEIKKLRKEKTEAIADLDNLRQSYLELQNSVNDKVREGIENAERLAKAGRQERVMQRR